MSKKLKVLFAGEEVFFLSTVQKGFRNFNMGSNVENSAYYLESLKRSGIEYDYIPTYKISEEFPWTLEELKRYDAVIFSDVSSDTVLVSERTLNGIRTPNRLDLIEQYVSEGGGFLMWGGYFSYTGLQGRGFYKHTAIERILPVELLPYDDRVETPEGIVPELLMPEHPVLQGLPATWEGWFLSYNRLIPKQEAEVLVKVPRYGDPFLVAGKYGKGRVLASAVDCAPHGASPKFLRWEYRDLLYSNMLMWLAGEK